MQIGLVCDEYPPRPHGGIGVYTQRLAAALCAAGHGVQVFELGCADAQRSDGGVQVISVGSRNRWQGRWRLGHVLRSSGCDVIEVPEYLGLLPWGAGAVPLLVRLHQSATALQMRTHGVAAPWWRWAEGATLGRATAWVGVGRSVLASTRKRFAHAQPQWAAVVPPPVTLAKPDHEWSSAWKPPARYLLGLGTVSPAKGVLRLAALARHAMQHDRELHLVLAGRFLPGTEAALRARLAAILGTCAARLHLPGAQPPGRVSALLHNAVVLVTCSPLESFALAVAEAMLAGLPVIAPAQPPFDELISHGQTGWLVQGWQREVWVAALDQALAGGDAVRAMGSAARSAIAARCAPAAVAEQMVGCYRRVVERKGKSRQRNCYSGS